MGNVDSALGQLEVDRDKGEVFEDWTMAPGELGGSPVTVFSAAHPPTSRKRPYIERALQASRVYRHPGLLKYIDGGIIGGEVVVVTERARPLLHQDLEMFSPLHISAGLLSVIETLVFLHDRAGVSHNNVSSSGIFVTSDGAWKLWGLEYSCSFGELTRDHIEHINSYCHEKSVPPDDKSRISPSYQHARDSYAFSCLVKEILTHDIITEIAGAEDFLNVINEKGLNKDWTQRPRLADLAKHQIFSHDFLKIHDNLSNVLLLHDHKREEFLQNVGEHLKQYPEELVSSTLAGALLSRPLLLHPAAVTHLMPMVLTPKTNDGTGGLFSEKVFERDIVPQIVRLFSVHDATVRSILLLYLPQYVHLVSEDILADEVLPELLLGIRDSSDTLVMSTLHALAHLVPILGANTVIGENRQNLFTTAKPKATPILPVNKVLAPHQVKSVKPKMLTSNGENINFTPSSDISKESEPPPPPPRSISLAPESITQDATPEVTSLDNLSLDSLIMSQIPERSSPDGGEDSGSPTNLLGVPGGVNCSDNEAWSDWEEMQDNTPSEDFSNVLLSLNQDHLKEDFHSKDNLKETGAQKIKGVSLKDGVHIMSSDTSNKSIHNSSMKKESGVNSNRGPKQSSGMKLTGLQFKENPEDILKKQKSLNIGDLGEEFDVLAIKVKKKHDEELDLFADIVPTFSTKKYDLETMLIEAKSKSQSSQKERSPSVSETLAGLDISGADIGEAWEEENWGEQIDFAVESPVKSRSDVLSKIASEGGVGVDTPVSSRDEYNEKIKELEKFTFQKPLVSNSVSISDEKEEWDNWGDEF